MNPFDILEKLESPRDGSEFVLYLLKGRSAYRVFKALDEIAPTEDDLQILLSTPDFLELIDEVAVVFGNIRDEVADMKKKPPVRVDDYVRVVETHYGQALDAAVGFAQLLKVSPEDLVSVLMNA